MASSTSTPSFRGREDQTGLTQVHDKAVASNTPATKTQNARDNFPLPPELRELVYSYLMGIKHDCLGANWSEAPARKFYPQIFRVNKTIREEALGYLYRNYQFVRIDYVLPDLDAAVLTCGVPFITAPAMRPTFDNYVLSIAARVEDVVRTWALPDDPEKIDSGTVFLLTDDLPALCDMLQMIGLQTSLKHVYIDTPRGTAIEPGVCTKEGCKLKLDITARQTAHGMFGSDQQVSFLQDLRAVQGSVFASIRGFALGDECGLTVESVIEEMCPSLVWLRAREWSALDALMRWKKRVDQLGSGPITSGRQIVLLTEAMKQLAKTIGHVRPLSEEYTSEDPDVRRAHEHIKTLTIDLRLNGAQTLIATNMVKMANEHLNGLSEFIDGETDPNWVPWIRLQLNLILYRYITGIIPDDDLEAFLHALQRYPFPQDKYFDHDITLAKAMLAVSKAKEPGFIKSSSKKLLPRISTIELPLHAINSLPPDDQLGRPENLQGWEDVRHKAELSEEEKEQVHWMQRRYGLPETSF